MTCSSCKYFTFCALSCTVQLLSFIFPINYFAVEDVSDLWPLVKKGFEDHLPFKRAFLNNKTRNPVLVDELPAEYILTTDSRLRSRYPQEQSLFWFREPYATVVLVSCEVESILGSLKLNILSWHRCSIYNGLVSCCCYYKRCSCLEFREMVCIATDQ